MLDCGSLTSEAAAVVLPSARCWIRAICQLPHCVNKSEIALLALQVQGSPTCQALAASATTMKTGLMPWSLTGAAQTQAMSSQVGCGQVITSCTESDFHTAVAR